MPILLLAYVTTINAVCDNSVITYYPAEKQW